MRRYREGRTVRYYEEGITEAGAIASFTARVQSYAKWGYPLIRSTSSIRCRLQTVGESDLGLRRPARERLPDGAERQVLADDERRRLPAMLDGQSMHIAMAVPNCSAYEPDSSTRSGSARRDGIHRMYGDDPRRCFDISRSTTQNRVQQTMPRVVEEGIVRGIYRYRAAPAGPAHIAAQISRAVRWFAPRSTAQLMPRRATRRGGVFVDVGACRLGSSSRRPRSTVERGTGCTPRSVAARAFVTEAHRQAEGRSSR